MRGYFQLFIGVLAIFFFTQPVLSFSLFGKKKQVKLPDYINEEIYIDKLFQATDGVYKLKLTILIPEGLETMTVTVMYDQLKQKKIENIAWVKGSYKSSKFLGILNSKKKVSFNRIFPFKKEHFVKENYEFEKESPETKYDRASQQRYIVYKRYQFYTKEIFGSGKIKFEHLIEFQFEDGTKKAIKVGQDIYRDGRLRPGEKILPTIFGKGTKPDPRYAPNPVLPKDSRDIANEEFNDYLQRQNDVIKSREEELYAQTMQELENSYGKGKVPDFDGLYRDKQPQAK